MKLILLSGVTSMFLLVGCGDSSKSGSSSGSPATAPADYLNTITKSEQKAVKTVDVTSVSQAIQMFNVQEGRFPKDLNELVEKKFMPKLPEVPYGSKFVYDADTGTVKIVKQ